LVLRSLLANINGVANGGSSGGSSSNTPSEPGLIYQFPSITNGTSDHLPPLKNSGTGSVTSQSNNKTHSNSGGSYNHYNNSSSNHFQSNGIVVDLDTMSNGAGGVNNGLTNGHSTTVSSATR
jgi:hypothetical protein